MNIFATIQQAVRFKKVTYYTVVILGDDEGEDKNLFLNFINNHCNEYNEELSTIRFWFKKIGNEIGAKERYFRHEEFRGEAMALPPPIQYLEFSCDLRLYCMLINENIVFLFDGAIKTENNAQDCPQVRPHFLLANRISKAIRRAIASKEIEVIQGSMELLFDKDLTLKI